MDYLNIQTEVTHEKPNEYAADKTRILILLTHGLPIDCKSVNLF